MDIVNHIIIVLSSVDIEFNKVFVLATEMANSVNVEPSMPQFAKRQIYNALSTDSLREKCSNTELFLVRIFPYSVRMR